MRNSPRFALVPLAALFSALPFVALSSPASADTAADCEAALSAPSAGQLTYTHDPAIRLAHSGQTVSLSAGWDPAAWDSLSLAVACIRLDDNTFDQGLSTSQAAPANSGAFGHSFTIPQVAAGTRLCTRIGLTGDPVGEATAATWLSKMHCYEVDHDLEEQVPPTDTVPTTQPPATTTTTEPTASPATSEAPPAAEVSASPPLVSEGAGSPVGAPLDSPAAPAGGPGVPGAATTPEPLPLLPATGYATPWLLRQGEGLLLIGVGLLVLCGRPRRRRQTA